MGRALWIPDKLRDYGVKVVLVGGWESRGSLPFTPQGVVAHHTGTPGWSEAKTVQLLIEGHPDLSGPLAQVGLDYHGRAQVVAAGCANHAGSTTNKPWRGLHGNRALLGIEAFSGGTGDWTAAQLDAYPRAVAALLDGIGRDESWCVGHREISTRGKVDPAGIDLDAFRSMIKDVRREAADNSSKSRGEGPMLIVHPDGHLFLLSGRVLTFLSGRASGEALEQLPTIHVNQAQFDAFEQDNRHIRGLV